MRSAAPVTQKHLSKPEDLMLQNATPLRESAPGPPKINIVLRLPRKMHLCRSSSNAPRLPSFLENATKPSRFAHFWQGAQSLAPCHAKRHLNVQSAPYPSVFCTFDFEMCFAPQRRALFRHLNFQKWSDAEVFCTFWLRNVLRATTSTS